ncbi:hypothetical protein ACUN0G_32790 [Pseudomonas sp. 32A]|uniref:hypothetical protein n=1 Tax=Pseudomonas sp. 32A TaxID=651185 RepID=UPI0040463250
MSVNAAKSAARQRFALDVLSFADFRAATGRGGLGRLSTGVTRSAYRADRKNPAYTRFDTRGSFYIDEHWHLAAKAQNLTNESYLSCTTSAVMAKNSVSLVL